MRWLITGAAGFLGANACRLLAAEGEVWGLTKSGQALPWCPTVVAGDLTDAALITQRVRETRPDVILHAAALADHSWCERDPSLAYAVNVEGAAAIARAGQEVGSEVVLISTDAVFSGATGGYRESDPVSPTTVYGETKVRAEEITSSILDALIIRTNFFGWSPSSRRSILEFFVNGLLEGRALPGFTNYVVTSIYVETLIRAISLAVSAQQTGLLHIASGDSLSKFEFGRTVAQEMGVEQSRVEPTLAAAADRNLSLNCERAQTLLGWEFPTQRAGIREALAHASPFKGQ